MGKLATFSVVRSSPVLLNVSSKLSKKKARHPRFSLNLSLNTTLLSLKFELWR